MWDIHIITTDEFVVTPWLLVIQISNHQLSALMEFWTSLR
jgi:hypothetical protein